jgi:hypothetical protein
MAYQPPAYAWHLSLARFVGQKNRELFEQKNQLQASESALLHHQQFLHAQSVFGRLNSTYYHAGDSTYYTTATKPQR